MERLEFAVREAIAEQTVTLTVGAIISAMLEDLLPLVGRLRDVQPNRVRQFKRSPDAENMFVLRAGIERSDFC